MPGHWEVYACEMNGRFATVVFRDRIFDVLESLPSKQLTIFKLLLKRPLENGMPSKEEAATLNVIEDEIESQSQQWGWLYVGRITSAGEREHFVYGGYSPLQSDELAQQISARHGYELFASARQEPDFASYWNDLYPSPEVRQSIEDEKVLENLKRHGDQLVVARRIDHLCIFPSRDAAERFAAVATTKGFELASIEHRPDDNMYWVLLYHTAVPAHGDITKTTVSLLHLATACGGDYDGWETLIVRDAS